MISAARGTGGWHRQRGFTLLELMIVVGIIAILASLALPYYRGAKRKAQEAVLKEDLWVLRDVLDQYFADKGRFPADLDTLVTEGYLKEIPVDPFTKSRDTWETIEVTQGEEEIDEEDMEQGGVYDVRSGATGQADDGSFYNEW